MGEKACPLAYNEGTYCFCKFDKSVSCGRNARFEECVIYNQALQFSHGTSVRELETLVIGD